MRLMMTVSASIVCAAVSAFSFASQDHHALDQRGERVMGFDQKKTTHHFLLFTDGGAIDVAANDASDTASRDAIRAHLPHIATMFGAGNFAAPMLVHDSTSVPGTGEMAARRDAIRYQYVETPRGGRVNIVTADPQALSAVHAFLRFQIKDHKTGDPTDVRRR